MDKQTAEILCNLTSDFYRRQAASFSQTRNHPWPGWRRCVEALAASHPSSGVVRVLDVACGNLRFEKFLQEDSSSCHAEARWDVCAVDNCDDLVGSPASHALTLMDAPIVRFSATEPTSDAAISSALTVRAAAEIPPASNGLFVEYVHADILDELFAGRPLTCVEGREPFDLVVSFGFMHHIPGLVYRKTFLRALISRVRPGGCVAVSFWRFMSDAALAEKSAKAHARALEWLAANAPSFDARNLEDGDFLLGWKDDEAAVRYCHHFTDDEINYLIKAVSDSAELVARFYADGRTNMLNSYVVLQRR